MKIQTLAIPVAVLLAAVIILSGTLYTLPE